MGAAGVVDDRTGAWASSGCRDVHTSLMIRLDREELECICEGCPECISYLPVLTGIVFHVKDYQHSA